jgi:hypothetical protein
MLTVAQENALPLDEALKRSIGATRDRDLAALYEWIGQNYDTAAYAKVQADYRGQIDPKFVAVCERVRKLLPVARWLGWHKAKGLRTLDLGSGAGHMGLIANYYGHSAEGLDCYALYDGLRAFWRQPAIDHRIEAGQPLPVGRYHSITSILTNYGRDWSIGAWDEFVGRILADHLEPGGEFVISFPGDPNLPARLHLRKRASRIEGRHMFFRRENAR